MKTLVAIIILTSTFIANADTQLVCKLREGRSGVKDFIIGNMLENSIGVIFNQITPINRTLIFRQVSTRNTRTGTWNILTADFPPFGVTNLEMDASGPVRRVYLQTNEGVSLVMKCFEN